MPREKSPSATELLQQVCDIMEERDLTEVLLREDGITLKVRRGSEPVPVAFSQPSDTLPLPSAEQVESPATQLSPEVGELVRSPMVGLFYASQSPEAAPYVEVGSVVSEDDTLCLIEAMKIFNEVKPDFPARFSKSSLKIQQLLSLINPYFA